MVLFRPLRLPQRLDKPLSVLVHKVCLCSKIDRGSPSLCSSLGGLSSTIQLRIDSSQPARNCPWKFHHAVHTNEYHSFSKKVRTISAQHFVKNVDSLTSIWTVTRVRFFFLLVSALFSSLSTSFRQAGAIDESNFFCYLPCFAKSESLVQDICRKNSKGRSF